MVKTNALLCCGLISLLGCTGSVGGLEPDASAPLADAAVVFDAGAGTTDAGSTTTDDAGMTSPDAGTVADGGTASFDAGTPVVDAGLPVPDGGTTALTFTQLPTTPDLLAPGRGLEFWIFQAIIPNPLPNSPSDNGFDRYDRFEWRSLQRGAATSYDFSEFDTSINTAIDKGQRFSFGVMNLCSSCTDFSSSVAGSTLSYPDFLHAQMQAESVPDWASNGTWVPNWNSPAYLTAWRNLQQALATHLATTSHAGVPYSKVIQNVDVRGYGDFGEWHNYPWGDTGPTGTTATAASLDDVVSSVVNAFPDFQLQAMVNSFDPGAWSNIPTSVSARLATSGNAHGRFGWRKDSWGATEAYWTSPLDTNPTMINGMPLRDSILGIWQHAPVTGEPYQCCTANGGTALYWDLPRQVDAYHLSSLGNGNLENPTNAATQSNLREASRRMGYRLVLTGGAVSSALHPGSTFLVELDWQNLGVAPNYEDWDVTFELRNSGGTAVWAGTSSFVVRHFLPASSATPHSDVFLLPANVTPGSYSLVMVIKDQRAYRQPLPLAITGRATDGSYPLSTVTVSL